jgi:hypothetical protein
MAKRPWQGILVLDSEKRFLEYTKPPLARKLVKEGKAIVISKDPFAIQLLHSKPIDSIRRKRRDMAIRNFTEYFKEERDVYVQNMASAQVSVEFPINNNRTEGFTFPHSRDPVNLTQHIPFDAIKSSMDFRKMLSRRPPALQLLSQEEYEAYFSKRAKSKNMMDSEGKPDVDAAIDESEERRRRTADRTLREPVSGNAPQPIHEVTEKGTGPGGAKFFGERERVSPSEMVSEDEIINPRVLHLCNQVKAEIEEEERMPARELLEALEDIPDMKLDDLEHIRAHGYYKSVKKWAKQRTAELIQQMEGDDADDEAAVTAG